MEEGDAVVPALRFLISNTATQRENTSGGSKPIATILTLHSRHWQHAVAFEDFDCFVNGLGCLPVAATDSLMKSMCQAKGVRVNATPHVHVTCWDSSQQLRLTLPKRSLAVIARSKLFISRKRPRLTAEHFLPINHRIALP